MAAIVTVRDKLEGDELQYNVPYGGEKRLKTDFLGISFKTPAGTKGGCDGKNPIFVMRPSIRCTNS